MNHLMINYSEDLLDFEMIKLIKSKKISKLKKPITLHYLRNIGYAL